MSFLTRKIKIPRPSPYWAMGFVIAWSIGLCVVDATAKLKVRRSMVLVKDKTHCDRYQKPSEQQVLVRVRPGDALWVRQLPMRGAGDCYGLEDKDGQRGWAPYNSAYLGSDGIDIRWRRFLVSAR